MKLPNRSRFLSGALFAAILVLVAVLLYDMAPLMENVADHILNEGDVVSKINGYGLGGILILATM